MAVPKRRQSTSRRDKRRSHRQLKAPNISRCPKCGEPRLPHTACPACGFYRGRQAIEVKER